MCHREFNLSQLVGTMYNICKVRGSNPDHHQKNNNNNVIYAIISTYRGRLNVIICEDHHEYAHK